MVTGLANSIRQPAYRRIAARLRAELLPARRGPGAFLPSEAALGRRFGVSRMTLRAALKNLQADGIIRPRRPLGWEILPRSVRLQRLICLVYGAGPASDFPMLRSAGLACQQRGLAFKPLFLDTWPDSLEKLPSIQAGAGVLVLSGPAAPDRLVEEIVEGGWPAAAVGFHTKRVDNIHPDWSSASSMLVRRLAGEGCRRLLYMGWGNGGEESFAGFEAGFRSAVAGLGLAGEVVTTALNWVAPAESHRIARILSRKRDPVDGIVIGSEALYVPSLQILQQLGRAISKDVSVTCLGEDPHPSMSRAMGLESLACVTFGWDAAVRWAVERIFARCKTPAMPVIQGEFPLTLVEGSSTRSTAEKAEQEGREAASPNYERNRIPGGAWGPLKKKGSA